MPATSRRPRPTLGRVLVTTDFSPVGDAAIQMAYAMASRGASLRLLHVAHPRAVGRGQFEAGVQTTPAHTAHLRALNRALRARVPRGAGRRGIAADACVVEHEDVAAAVAAEAERYDADAVVIASHGETGVRALVIGSTAQAVMARCRRPVVVVKGRGRN